MPNEPGDSPAPASPRARPHREVVPLAVVAILLGVVGGLVPVVDHQVRMGVLPEVLDPERYLGPPAIGSISGRFAVAGALAWAAIATVGTILARAERVVAIVLLACALLITAVVNVILPLQLDLVEWSPIGVLQTIAIAAALACLAWPRRTPPRSTLTRAARGTGRNVGRRS